MLKSLRSAAVIGTFLLSSVIFTGCSPSTWKAKSGLQVLTNDVPSSVFLDGKFLDNSPYVNKELKPGEYTLEIRPNDTARAPYQAKVSLKKGLLTVVNWRPGTRPETSGGVIYEMEPAKNKKKTELSLTTIPDGAIVHVDGKAQGFSPVLMEDISPGEHEYEIKLPSYETQKHTINALEGYRMIVTLKLAKQEYTGTATTETTLGTSATGSASLTSTVSAKIPSATSAAAKRTLATPKIVINSTKYFSGGKEVLRVRDSSTPAGKELGFAPVGEEYSYLNESENGWHKISFNGTPGWVSGQFVTLLK